jgi:hypothetical protein
MEVGRVQHLLVDVAVAASENPENPSVTEQFFGDL